MSLPLLGEKAKISSKYNLKLFFYHFYIVVVVVEPEYL